jgi:hypothetical protein
MKIAVKYRDSDREFAYDVPDGLTVEVGDVVKVPRTPAQTTRATVVSLTSSYTGPCKEILGILEHDGKVLDRSIHPPLRMVTHPGNYADFGIVDSTGHVLMTSCYGDHEWDMAPGHEEMEELVKLVNKGVKL